jgi:hypothetical protein
VSWVGIASGDAAARINEAVKQARRILRLKYTSPSLTLSAGYAYSMKEEYSEGLGA